jgi:hypothetical protein
MKTDAAENILSMGDMPASFTDRLVSASKGATRIGGTYSKIDDERAARDEAAAKISGFAMAPPIYVRGTTVVGTGVDNAAAKRAEWEAMPTAEVECARLAATIHAEERRNFFFNTADMRMTGAGRIGPVKPDGKGVLASFPIEPEALASVFTRVSAAANVRSPGAAMADLSWGSEDMTRVRAQAMNAIAVRAATVEQDERAADPKATASKIMLRTRAGRPDADGHRPRQIFAAVSDSYAAFDIDKIADACGLLSKESDLRCEAKYNGRSATINLIGNTNVNPKYFVAGEVFRAGISVKSDDTGKGGIKVTALAWRNLCLNLIIIDRAEIKIATMRHIGDVRELSNKLAAALNEAQGKIQYFLDSWNIACKKALVDDVRQIGGLESALDEISARVRRQDDAHRELLGGVFRGLADEDKIPLSLRTVDAIMGDLLEAHDDDRNMSGAREHGPTRASVANAITLYAHAYQRDAEVESELEAAAGRILTARGKLPYLPLVA